MGITEILFKYNLMNDEITKMDNDTYKPMLIKNLNLDSYSTEKTVLVLNIIKAKIKY